MKKYFDQPRSIFALLMAASVIAITAGTYLGITLGMTEPDFVGLMAAMGILLWAKAWGEFLAMCCRLHHGESAFTSATGRTLRSIGRCMAGLAAVALLCALFDGVRTPNTLYIIETVLLPGFFLAVGVAAKVLHGLLEHAMALEEEQEGVV